MEGGTLLAIDLGLWTGLAVFGPDGRCRRYRSTHFPNAAAIKKSVSRILAEAGEGGRCVALVCEGDRELADIWTRAGTRRGIVCEWTSAEVWREALLWPHERRDGEQAKDTADRRAREVIAWSGGNKPISLRHDAAEAILIGLWGCIRLGWLDVPPWPAPGLHSRGAR
jgi:hypothetical protein